MPRRNSHLSIAGMFATITNLLAFSFACELLGARKLLFMQTTATFLFSSHGALKNKFSLENWYIFLENSLRKCRILDDSAECKYAGHRTTASGKYRHTFPPPHYRVLLESAELSTNE